jgi:hypothetical protein
MGQEKLARWRRCKLLKDREKVVSLFGQEMLDRVRVLVTGEIENLHEFIFGTQRIVT